MIISAAMDTSTVASRIAAYTASAGASSVCRRRCRSLDMALRSVIGYVEGRGKEKDAGETDIAAPQQYPEPYPWVLKKALIGLRLWTV